MWDLFDKLNGFAVLNEKKICETGAKNWPFFTIQVLKISSEVFTVTVYACGPSRNRRWFYLRYLMLILSMLAAIVLSVLS